MNRRRFIQCVTSAIAGTLAFGRPVLRSVTKEQSVTLGNRSLMLLEPWGISSSDVCQRIDEQEEIERIAHRLQDCAETCSPRLYAQIDDCAGADFDPARAIEVNIDASAHWEYINARMQATLVANPEMERDQAFFLAVMEIAEESI